MNLLSIIAPLTLALQAAPGPTPPVRPAAPVARVTPPPGYPVTGPRYCTDGAKALMEGSPAPGLFVCIDRVNGLPALMTVTDAGHLVGRASQLDVNTALALLADTRLQLLWPEVEALLGPDGSALRQSIFDGAEAAWRRGRAPQLTANRATMESMNDSDARAILDYTLELDRIGRTADALALLDRVMPQPVEGRLSDEREYEYLSFTLRRAHIFYVNRRFDEAIAELERLEASAFIYGDYRINATVNRAAYLVEIGRHAEALTAIEAALQQFRNSGGDAMRIDGSSRQFAWIRACAMHHLGRVEEARGILGLLDRSPERPMMPNAAVPTTSSIALRAALCLDDDARLAAILRLDGGAPYPWPFANHLQQAYRPVIPAHAATLQRAIVRLREQGVTVPVRQLPPAYAAALGGWRDRDGGPSPAVTANAETETSVNGAAPPPTTQP